VEEVTDEPLYRDRVCGIDIGKAGLVATIRVPSDRDPARRMQETRSFGTTKNEVLALADWLRSWQVPAVVMEATGARLLERPVLPAGGRRVRLRASRRQAGQEPARPAQAGPGRFPLAGGVLRARRRHLLLRGHPGVPDHPAAHPVPAGPDRGAHPGEAAGGEATGIREAAVKISSVLTDLHGVTGRGIMDRLIAGERNPKVLAQLARAAARRKIRQLEEAVEGAEFFTAGHAALLQIMLARIDRLAAGIDDLSQVIERLLAPYEEQLQQAESMPGWQRRAAQDAVAETGVDMSRFRTGPHLVSWGGRAPQDHQSGKRAGRATAKKGNRYLGAITGETAVAAGRTQTREGARHRRLARRRGAAKACVATGNTQLKVYHKLLSNPGMRYEDLGPDYYERQRDTRRQVAHHVGKLGALGFEVTLCRIPEPDPDGTDPAQAA
jgi:transposase